MIKYMRLNAEGHAEVNQSVKEARDQVEKDLKLGLVISQKKEGENGHKLVKFSSEIDEKTVELAATEIPTKG